MERVAQRRSTLVAVLGPGGEDPGRHYDVDASRNTHARKDGNESRRHLGEESLRPLLAPVHPPPLSQPEEVIAERLAIAV